MSNYIKSMLPPYRLNKYAPLNRGLVGKWICLPGQMGGIYWYDLVGKNKGTLINMTSGYGWNNSVLRPGGWGSMRFDGSDDWVSIPGNTSFSSLSGTVSIWFRTTVSHVGNFVRRDSGSAPDRCYGLRISGTAIQGFLIFGTIPLVSSANGFADGNWHMATMSWLESGGSTSLYLYVDAKYIGTASTAGTMPSSSVITRLGTYNVSTESFNGYLDDGSFYNRALSSGEVYELYKASKSGYKKEIISSGDILQEYASGITYSLPEETYQNALPNTTLSQKYRPSTWSREITTATTAAYHVSSKSILSSNRDMKPPYKLNPYAPLNRGLVGKWICLPGNSAGKYWYDLCGKNKGTLTNFTSGYGWQGAMGRPGGWGAMRFDGSDDYVDCGTSNLFQVGTGKNLSLALWFRTTQTTNWCIVARARYAAATGRWAFLREAGATSFFIGDTLGGTYVSVTATHLDGIWHHVVGTYASDGVINVYLDGGKFTASGNRTPSTSATYNLLFGKYNDTSGGATGTFYQYTGDADDISIYDRALSAGEVAGLYEASKNQYRNEILSGGNF